MKYRTHGYREGDFLFQSHKKYVHLWNEIDEAILSITEEMVVDAFESNHREAKSVSQAINMLLKVELEKRGWNPESYIFADEKYGKQQKGVWRLDFAKESLSVEVAFNHRSDISWNMIKPTLASELNHVEKAIQTDGGIIITATHDLKKNGGFDSACGTFEDYVQYLRPMGMILTAPMVIIGLEAPESYYIDVQKITPSKKVGRVVHYATEA